MTKPQPDPLRGLKWPPGEPEPARHSFGFEGDGPIASFDAWQQAMERKAAAQARERKRLGLEPADFVDYGCEGEPKPPNAKPTDA
jgi:hypothetical protein